MFDNTVTIKIGKLGSVDQDCFDTQQVKNFSHRWASRCDALCTAAALTGDYVGSDTNRGVMTLVLVQ